MKTIFDQKSQNIRSFAPGTIITRIEPATSSNSGSTDIFDFDGSLKVSTGRKDSSYIGEPMRFIGIANGCVLVESGFDKRIRDLRILDGFEDGWSEYIDPNEIRSMLDESLQQEKKS
jgi:hypothetical protein